MKTHDSKIQISTFVTFSRSFQDFKTSSLQNEFCVRLVFEIQ